MSLLEQQQKYIAAAAIADRLYNQSPSDKGLKETYIDLYSAAGRDYLLQQLPDSALYAYGKILKVEPANEQALNSSINVLSAQKKYNAALTMVDKALGYLPGNERLLLKKAGLLQEDEQDEAAALIFEELQSRKPGDNNISNNLVEAQLVVGRKMMQAMDYDGAATAFGKVLDIQPQHKEALNTMINIDLARGRAGIADALQHSADALIAYPNDKEFLLKRSTALFNSGRYEEAYTLTGGLLKKYPYNTKIRESFIEQMTAVAALQRKNGDTAAALASYNRVLLIKPDDTTVLLSVNNIYFNGGNYDAVLSTSDTALFYHPETASFLLKKAAALEQLQRHKRSSSTNGYPSRLIPGTSLLQRLPGLPEKQKFL